MTEERKQELRRLLEEATAVENLEIRYEHARGTIYGYGLRISVSEYQRYVQQRWSAYSKEPTWFSRSVKPHIVSEPTKSKLLNFIREELSPFVEEDSVYFASYTIEGNHGDGFRLEPVKDGGLMLDVCLNHLLKIAVVCGVEEAVSVFERCTRGDGPHFHFQHVASLEGISLETEVQVCKGVRLVTVRDSQSGVLPSQLAHLFFWHDMREYSLAGKTLLIIDRPVFSISHKPSQEALHEGNRIDDLPFQFHLNDEKFTHSSAVRSFVELFCQALSLACNSSVHISGGGWLLEEGKFFHPGNGGIRLGSLPVPLVKPIRAEEAEINDAKRLYQKLYSTSAEIALFLGKNLG